MGRPAAAISSNRHCIESKEDRHRRQRFLSNFTPIAIEMDLRDRKRGPERTTYPQIPSESRHTQTWADRLWGAANQSREGGTGPELAKRIGDCGTTAVAAPARAWPARRPAKSAV